ncbi:MAG: SUMF1/EgtB/PvdO family nonheme iron enzyme, partial [bacterium]|nr:SUMF1/EgtB/PvdO family nonheme iron enzyme [bacterium]
VHRYSSLLLERGRGQYGFIHQTLEEYLAGCGLTLLPKEKALREILTHLNESHWRETLLLGIGVLGIVRKDPHAAGALLEEIMQAELPVENRGLGTLLAGQVLRDVGETGVGRRVFQRIQTTLVETMQDAAVESRRRQEAGLILGDTGWRSDDLNAFVAVEPGTFFYGDRKRSRTIDYRYWIAKYPVTNAQFARFVEAGHDEPKYWTDRSLNNPLLPIVGVSWNQAQVYCRWLNEKLRAEGFRVLSTDGLIRLIMPDGYEVRLPTEIEWERAARGTDGREYPWNGGFDAARANTRERGMERKYGIGATAVCTYPQGESPDGVWDMVGNVWEWTKAKGSVRSGVVRGGCWSLEQGVVCCACRNRYHPFDLDYDTGFRVVVSLTDSEF